MTFKDSNLHTKFMQASTLTLTFKYYNSYDLFMRILKISIFICIPLLFFLLKLFKLLLLLGTYTALQRYARIILLFMSLVSYFTNPSCTLMSSCVLNATNPQWMVLFYATRVRCTVRHYETTTPTQIALWSMNDLLAMDARSKTS